MRATTIQLYSRGGVGGYEDRYCGCWHVPCPDGDPRIPDLDEVGCGRFRDEDGTANRAFFFADEIEEMVERAERTTGCIVEVDESWPYPRTGRDELQRRANEVYAADRAEDANRAAAMRER